MACVLVYHAERYMIFLKERTFGSLPRTFVSAYGLLLIDEVGRIRQSLYLVHSYHVFVSRCSIRYRVGDPVV